MEIKLWSDEFFIDKIERVIKNEIGMYFHVHHDRYPSKEEIESFFDRWKSKLECNITSFDLGILE